MDIRWLKPKEPISKKWLYLFVILLIPNLLRQVIYWTAYLKTNTTDFIASFETKIMYASGFPYAGIAEEVLIGMLFVFFWHWHPYLRFFAYGWVADAFIDFVSVFVWSVTGLTPMQMLGLGIMTGFVMRELVLSYCVLGLVTFKLKTDIRIASLVYSAVGLSVLLML